MATGTIKTGVQSTIKSEAENADAATKQKEAAELKAAEEVTATKDQIVYTKKGHPVFNCQTDSGLRIEFMGGKFIVEKNNEDFEEICRCLDFHCKRGRLVKEEG